MESKSSKIRKYLVRGHYTSFSGRDYPDLPEVIEAYTAEDAITQLKINYQGATIHNISPFKRGKSE